MRIGKLVIGILILNFISCKDSKNTENKTQPPKVEFDISEMKQNVSTKSKFKNIFDLDSLFTDNQKNELDKLLIDFKKKNSFKIIITTMPKNSITPNKFIEIYNSEFEKRGLNQKIDSTVINQIIEELKYDSDWKIKSQYGGEGIWIIIDNENKEIEISVDKKMKEIIPQKILNKILAKNTLPFFKQGKYFKGIKNGVNSIIEKVN